MTVENCVFLYPSCSQRMLKSEDAPQTTIIEQPNPFSPSHCTIRKCLFQYTDGDALRVYGDGNIIENCYFYHIDYSCASLPSLMVTVMMKGINNIFRRNTIHRTGASSVLIPGENALIELNDIYDTGYLQSDGALIQCMVGQQPGVEIRYNWLHNTVKYGARFDGEPGGVNGLIHHNVVWNTQGGLMVKGDYHKIYNNTCFNNEPKNDIIIMAAENYGGNNHTITQNNAANKISGDRTKSVQNVPIPGINSNNWNGYLTGIDLKDLLVDPDSRDFRPRPGSVLIDAAVKIPGINDNYAGRAPDIGAYEYGGDYWVPGITWNPDSVLLSYIESRNRKIPIRFELYQNFPNPFNSKTKIEFDIQKLSFVRLEIYNIRGQLLENFLNKKMLPGFYSLVWDASNYSSGVYYYSLKVGNRQKTRKCILVK